VVNLVADFVKNQGKGDLSNVCTYLIEQTLTKALGGQPELVGNMLQMDSKSKRQYHDDITITVVFFNTDNLPSNGIDRIWMQDSNFSNTKAVPMATREPSKIPPVATSSPSEILDAGRTVDSGMAVSGMTQVTVS